MDHSDIRFNLTTVAKICMAADCCAGTNAHLIGRRVPGELPDSVSGPASIGVINGNAEGIPCCPNTFFRFCCCSPCPSG